MSMNTEDGIDYESDPPHPRRDRVIVLSEAQIDDIAQRVEDRFYQRVGKKLVEKILWLCGIVVVGLAAWLSTKGLLDK